MQDYQFNKIQETGDQPLDDDTRILQAEDIDRYSDRLHAFTNLLSLDLKFLYHPPVCPLGGHFIPHNLPLSAQVYKWVPGDCYKENLLAGGTCNPR